MSRIDPALARECEIFTRFLVGAGPDAYVAEQYAKAHEVTGNFRARTRFEARVLGIARKLPALLPAADACVQLIAPRCVFRRKLVLMFAILESSAPFYRVLEDVPPKRPHTAILEMSVRGVGWLATLLLGMVIFLPIRLMGDGPCPAGTCDES